MSRRSRRALAVLALLPAGGAAYVLRPLPAAPPTGSWMAAAGVEPRFETVDGVKLRYVRRGSGPPVVLLHGIASSVYTWKEVLPVLAADHDVLALDLPGFGGSDIPDRFELALYPRLVLGLLERLGLPRVSVAGNSLGGAIAVMLAAERPQAVDRLVLIDAAGFNLDPRDRPWILRVAGRHGLADVIEALPALRRPMLRLGLRQVFHDEAFVTPERLHEYAVPLARPGATRFVQAVLSSSGSVPFGEIVRSVRAPTLVLWGEQDRWIPPRDAARFAQAIHGARVVTLSGCGHVPQEECPPAVLTHLRPFLSAAPPERGLPRP